MYNFEELREALAGSVLAGKVHFARVTESTNSDAMAAGRSGAPHGSVWVADEQTAGRGRGDHRWHSAAGEGLYVSVLLRLDIPTARLALLPLAAGLAAAEAIGKVTGLAVDLRWPNDLLIGARKTGGILVEAGTGMAGPFAVCGTGINVHQREFAPELATAATSLDLESGRHVPRQELLLALLRALEREVTALADTGLAEQIPMRVEQSSTWVRGRRVEVHGPQACTGMTAGLDANGFLRVATVGGLVTVLTGGIRAAEG